MKRVLNVEECKGKEILLSDYTHLRAYHACRPESIQPYKGGGLQPLNRNTALHDAISKLSDDRITVDRVIAQVDKVWAELYATHPPKVWLALDPSELLNDSSHYLIYGSEFLNAVAMWLGCRDKLKTIGKPTIVVCDVPIADISETWLRGLEEAIENDTTSMRSIAVNQVLPHNVVDFIYPMGWVNDPYTDMRYNLTEGNT